MFGIARALHFVFKVGDRPSTIKFFRDVLGMKILRHEEFEAGCKATCNGPYDGKWSKTMIGFGSEDNHFVIELTYNYGVQSYNLGNDFLGITVQSKEARERAAKHNWPMLKENILEAPGGYKFHILNEPQPVNKDPVKKVTLASSNLKKSIEYWSGLCGMKVYSQDDEKVELGFSDEQCKLELVDIGTKVNHATAFGRIAFSCPRTELPKIQEIMQKNGQNIITPLVSLDTPGKATVEVVILGDVDGHEICFVGDEAFRELSQVDPNAEKLLDEAMAADKSNEWFAKKGIAKAQA